MENKGVELPVRNEEQGVRHEPQIIVQIDQENESDQPTERLISCLVRTYIAITCICNMF